MVSEPLFSIETEGVTPLPGCDRRSQPVIVTDINKMRKKDRRIVFTGTIIARKEDIYKPVKPEMR
jgi:hypothetical protein